MSRARNLSMVSIATVLLAGLCVLPGGVAAQDAGAPAVARVEIIERLDFRGGSVADYVDAVRKAAPGVNIVVAPHADEVRLGPVTLRTVGTMSALQLLKGMAETTPGRIVQLDYQLLPATSRDTQPIHMVHATVAAVGRSSGGAEHSSVSSVAGLLAGGMKAADVMTAIETGLDLLGDRYAPAKLRFHEETGLVIARGHPEQTAIIEEIIDQLRAALAARPDRKVQAMQTELEMAHVKVAQLEQVLADAQASVTQSARLEARLEVFEQEAKVLRAQLDQRDRQIRELNDRLADAEARLRDKGSE